MLFSDVESGLLHEEMACRLKLRLSREVTLLNVLTKYGIALYVWSSAYKELHRAVQQSLSPTPYPRLLKWEMLFDESENLYDSSIFRHDTTIEKHVKEYLFMLVPDGRAIVEASASTYSETVPSNAPVLQFLSAYQFKARLQTNDFGGRIRQVVLGCMEHERAPLPLSSPMTKRLMHRSCIGEADDKASCSRLATREVRYRTATISSEFYSQMYPYQIVHEVSGMGKCVVCDTCNPWKAFNVPSFFGCQFSQSGSVCGAPATLMLEHESQDAPKHFCNEHAVLVTVSPAEAAGAFVKHVT